MGKKPAKPAEPVDSISMRDNLSGLTDQRKCVARIRKYWADRGYKIKVDLIPRRVTASDGVIRTTYSIKSDLLNGLPPGYEGALTDLERWH